MDPMSCNRLYMHHLWISDSSRIAVNFSIEFDFSNRIQKKVASIESPSRYTPETVRLFKPRFSKVAWNEKSTTVSSDHAGMDDEVTQTRRLGPVSCYFVARDLNFFYFILPEWKWPCVGACSQWSADLIGVIVIGLWLAGKQAGDSII